MLAALHHIHYVRSGLVFLNEIKHLPDSINQRNFTVKKNSRVFPVMGLNQVHEQIKWSIKKEGGAIGIIDNESALLE